LKRRLRSRPEEAGDLLFGSQGFILNPGLGDIFLSRPEGVGDPFGSQGCRLEESKPLEQKTKRLIYPCEPDSVLGSKSRNPSTRDQAKSANFFFMLLYWRTIMAEANFERLLLSWRLIA
jgi:hypothetical protein